MSSNVALTGLARELEERASTGKPIRIKDLIIKICDLVGSGKPEFGKISLRKDEIKRLYPKTLKSKKLLNWKSNVSLEKGLIKTIKYYKNYKD